MLAIKQTGFSTATSSKRNRRMSSNARVEKRQEAESADGDRHDAARQFNKLDTIASLGYGQNKRAGNKEVRV